MRLTKWRRGADAGGVPLDADFAFGARGKFHVRPARVRFSATVLWCNLMPLDWLVRKMGGNLRIKTDNCSSAVS